MDLCQGDGAIILLAGEKTSAGVGRMLLRAIAVLMAGGLLPSWLWAQGLKLTGTWQVRGERWEFFKLPNADNDYNFLGSAIVASLSRQSELEKWHVEVAHVTFLGLPQNAAIPSLGALYRFFNRGKEGSLFLRQFFWQRKSGKDTWVQVGRFKFGDGAERLPPNETLLWLRQNRIQERLIGSSDFTLIGRSFDGIQITKERRDGTFTFALLRPTRGIFDLRGDDQLTKVTTVYASWTFSPDPKTDARIFALYYRDSRKPPLVVKLDNRPLTIRQADSEPISILTLGGHILRALPDNTGQTDFLAWGAWQFGDWGKLKHRAFAVSAEFGHQWEGKCRPWLRIGASLSTGDGNPNDAYHRTFFQILPSLNQNALPPIFNLMNSRILFAQLRLQPSRKVDLQLETHWVWLSRKADLWYSGAGAFNNSHFGFFGLRGGERQVLNMIGLTLNYRADPSTAWSLYLARIWGKGVVRTNFAGNSATYAYLQATHQW